MSLLVPRPEARRPWWHVALIGLAACGGHVVLAGLWWWSAAQGPALQKKKVDPKPVNAALRRIDAKTWATNRGAAARTVTPVVERPVPVPKGQVVDVAPGNNRRPTESKFLAETNNTVERETRARETTNTWSKAAPKNSANPAAEVAKKGVAAKSPEVVEPEKSGVSLSESLLGRRERPTLFPPSLPSTAQQGEPTDAVIGSEQGAQNGVAGATASEGGGAPNDALDVPEGDGTYLNTREWRFAAFFNRVKQAVSAKWDPNARLRAKGRKGIGVASRTTVMVITLRPDGSLADAYVGSSSGFDELDAEALRAFERAAPFPNPPASLVKNGVIQFQFGFNVSEDMSPLRFNAVRY